MLQAIVAGVFTLAAVLTTLMVQGWQQRRQAQDERLWGRRADTYVAMFRYRGSGMVEGYRGAASLEEWEVRDELTAKAGAFASDRVYELWQQSASSHVALQGYIDEEWPQWHGVGEEWRLAVEEEMESDLEFRRLRQARTDVVKQLAEQIRVELDVHRCEGVKRWPHAWPKA